MSATNNTVILKRPKETVADILACGGCGPAALEIGFGNGEFLTHLAAQSPHGTFFGIEVSMQAIMRTWKRARRMSLENVFLLYGDARFLLRECFAPETFDHIYMNFPCPWPKNRHAKRRVTSGDFGDALVSSLSVGGVFELATDDPVFGLEAKRKLGSRPDLDIDKEEKNTPGPVTTKYERKWLDQSKDIFRFGFKKNRAFSLVPVCGGETEVHAVLKRACPSLEDISLLCGREGGAPEKRWVFRESYRSAEGVMLIEVVASDDGFQQSFFVRIVPKAEECLIKADRMTRPFWTPAAKSAFEDLAGILGESG